MENAEAKKLFFHYNGSKFHMDREGDYAEYSKYNVNKETEKNWMEELIQIKFKQYKETSDFRDLYVLTNNERYDLLEKILEVEIKGTLLNKIVVMEMLAEFLVSGKKRAINYEIYKNKIINYCNIMENKKYSKENIRRIN